MEIIIKVCVCVCVCALNSYREVGTTYCRQDLRRYDPGEEAHTRGELHNYLDIFPGMCSIPKDGVGEGEGMGCR